MSTVLSFAASELVLEARCLNRFTFLSIVAAAWKCLYSTIIFSLGLEPSAMYLPSGSQEDVGLAGSVLPFQGLTILETRHPPLPDNALLFISFIDNHSRHSNHGRKAS